MLTNSLHLNRDALDAFICYSSILAACVLAPIPSYADATQVTFNKDVAPIFFEHCAMCHRPGEIAPMSLLTYREARPWAKSIALQVSEKNMPPFSGDSDHREWSNDISLSDEKIKAILNWVEQGTREGDPGDLPEAPSFSDGWTLGEPDYVMTLDPVAVPAGGDDIFPKQWATIDIDQPEWVRAIEFLPGDRRVAHHVLATYGPGGSQGASGILAVWTAGMPPYEFPEGVGRVVEPGGRVQLDLHYHAYGEATEDTTRIGFYFGKGELKKQVSTMTIANTGLRIPAGSANHEETAFHLFDQDMQILAFSPHLHVRGKSMRYDLTYPDGRREVLLDVPKYNFNWQWLYYPTEPIDIPAGSRLDVTAAWNNSSDNPSNPDPTKEIIYRGDTFNEMFVGFFEAVPKEGVYFEPASAVATLENLLRQHPDSDTFLVGGFLPLGIYAPRQGEGWLYLVQGGVMFTITLDDFDWNGGHLAIRTQLPTPNASATTTIIEGQLDEQGQLIGAMQYGADGGHSPQRQTRGNEAISRSPECRRILRRRLKEVRFGKLSASIVRPIQTPHRSAAWRII